MQTIEKLRRIGYVLGVKGEGTAAKISCKFTGDKLPDPATVTPLLQELKQYKDAAIAYICAFPLSQRERINKALRERGIVAIQSEALDGEVIYFVLDDTHAKRAPGGAVVYTLDELQAIVGAPPSKDRLKQIHTAKKIFNGQVVSAHE